MAKTIVVTYTFSDSLVEARTSLLRISQFEPARFRAIENRRGALAASTAVLSVILLSAGVAPSYSADLAASSLSLASGSAFIQPASTAASGDALAASHGQTSKPPADRRVLALSDTDMSVGVRSACYSNVVVVFETLNGRNGTRVTGQEIGVALESLWGAAELLDSQYVGGDVRSLQAKALVVVPRFIESGTD